MRADKSQPNDKRHLDPLKQAVVNSIKKALETQLPDGYLTPNEKDIMKLEKLPLCDNLVVAKFKIHAIPSPRYFEVRLHEKR